MSKPPKHEHIAPRGEYANFMNIRFNLNEVVIDFGQRVPDDQFVRMHSRIITSPQHLARFKQLIESVLVKIGKRAKEANENGDDGNGGRQ